MALVFAIFELNPSPFCMLDEVDAPLDDANVGRFCALVREMSERVQFIYITHNKTTMEMANQLTGVTMHEAGVSRLVAVDVDEAVQLVARKAQSEAIWIYCVGYLLGVGILIVIGVYVWSQRRAQADEDQFVRTEPGVGHDDDSNDPLFAPTPRATFIPPLTTSGGEPDLQAVHRELSSLQDLLKHESHDASNALPRYNVEDESVPALLRNARKIPGIATGRKTGRAVSGRTSQPGFYRLAHR